MHTVDRRFPNRDMKSPFFQEKCGRAGNRTRTPKRGGDFILGARGLGVEAPRAFALRASAGRVGTRATRAAVQGRRGRAVAGGDARESGSNVLKRGRLVRCAGGWRRSSVRTFSAVRGVENARGVAAGFFASARWRNGFSRTFFPTPRDFETRTKNRGVGPVQKSSDHPFAFSANQVFRLGRCHEGTGSKPGGRKKILRARTRDWTGEESYAFARYFFPGQSAGPFGFANQQYRLRSDRASVQLADQKGKTRLPTCAG